MILLTGGSGQLGSAFMDRIDEVIAPPREEFDLTRPGSLDALLGDLSPSAIVNCAAYTAVDRAEDEPDVALAVNAESVVVMAGFAARAGIPFVTFSTDFVFDGTATVPYVESSPTGPVNAYGMSKERGERGALQAHPGALVIRTSWLISNTHPNFVTSIVSRAADGPVSVVTDQIGSPTHVVDLAEVTLAAVGLGAAGLLHVANSGSTSRFELARFACRAAGLDASLIEPTTSDDFPTSARRPRFSVLASERLADLGIAPLRTWEDAVSEVVSSTR